MLLESSLGAVLQTCTKTIEVIFKLRIFNILGKKKLQMELFIYNIIFNTLIYMSWKFEINLMNKKHLQIIF
jgi:hypothetical protein